MSRPSPIPRTGVTVYDTYHGDPGFEVFGGTSVSSPIIASVYALAGNGASIDDAGYAYAHASSLFDITKGSQRHLLAELLLPRGPGYDGPTGLGTPERHRRVLTDGSGPADLRLVEARAGGARRP